MLPVPEELFIWPFRCSRAGWLVRAGDGLGLSWTGSDLRRRVETRPAVPANALVFPGVPAGLCNRCGWAAITVAVRFGEAGEDRVAVLESWVRPLCGLVVSGVAVYAFYVHQRHFALKGGADRVSASLRPLLVDDLPLLATIGVLRRPDSATRRARGIVCAAFLLEIAVSLAANIVATSME